MPFYLVSHTALIEAKNEEEAARQVRENLRTQTSRFTVKYDEATIATVELAGDPPATQEASLSPEACDKGEAATTVVSKRFVSMPHLLTISLLALGVVVGFAAHAVLP